VFWIITIIDDWNLFNKQILKEWFEMFKWWGLWYLGYALVFIIYYWIFATAIIFIYHALKKISRKF